MSDTTLRPLLQQPGMEEPLRRLFAGVLRTIEAYEQLTPAARDALHAAILKETAK